MLDRLPESPTEADLEVAYVSRGAALLACEAARELAVATLLAEREMQDRWREAGGNKCRAGRQILPGPRHILPGG